MDKNRGQLLGKICDYVYLFDETDLPSLGNPNVVKIRDKSGIQTSYAGILRYPNMTVLAFQGTITNQSVEAVKDWLQDFMILRVPALGLPGLVHQGFAVQLELIWDKILNELKNPFSPPLYVTGHSQGAAVAVLATKALEMAGIKVEETYTFAAPRPGDATFAASVNTPVYRFEFGDDIVPHVPFHGFSLDSFQEKLNAQILAKAPELEEFLKKAAQGYQAVGQLIYRRPGSELHVVTSEKDEKSLQVSRDIMLAFANKDLFNHHHMPHYINMLN
ncbi:MAG: lipase family protein [Gemmataceae bacterium]